MNLPVAAAAAYETREQIATSIFMSKIGLAYSPANGRHPDVMFNDTATEITPPAIQREQDRRCQPIPNEIGKRS